MEQNLKFPTSGPGPQMDQVPDEIVNSIETLNQNKVYPKPLTSMVKSLRSDSKTVLDVVKSNSPSYQQAPTINPTEVFKTKQAESNPILDQLGSEPKLKWSRESSAKRSDVFEKLNTGEEVAKYKEGFFDFRDNNEYYAQRQTAGEKWLNGLQKFVSKTLVGVGGNILGSAYGLGEAIVTGNFDATYDNSFMRTMDDLNTRLDNKLPNFYTAAERDLSISNSLLTSNFWADKVLSGAQFTASAIASEALMAWATGGGSLSTTGARLGLNMASKGASTANKFRNIMNAETKALRALGKEASKLNAIEVMAKSAELSNREMRYLRAGHGVGKLADNARYLYMSSAYESGFETRQFEKDMRAEFREKYPEATNEEFTQFEEGLKQASSFVYRMNMGIVGPSNFFGPMAKLLGRGKTPAFQGSAFSRNFLGAGARKVDGKYVSTVANNWQKALRTPTFLAKSALPEALEEGGQGLTTQGAEKWLFAQMTDENIKDMADILAMTMDEMGAYAASKEGREEMFIGGLIGALMGGAHSLRSGNKLQGEYASTAKAAEQIEKFAADTGMKQRLVDQMIYGNSILVQSKRLDEAIQEEDYYKADMAVTDGLLINLTEANNLEYLDQTIREYKEVLKAADLSQIMQAYGLESDQIGIAENIRDTRLEEFTKLAESYQKNKKFVDRFFGDKLTASEKEQFGQDIDMRNAKNMIIYNLTRGEKSFSDMHDAFNDIVSEYADIAGDTKTGSLNVLLELDKAEATRNTKVKELKTEFNKLKKQLKRKEKARDKAVSKGEINVKTEVKRTNSMEALAKEITDIQLRQQEIANELSAIIKASQRKIKNPFTTTTKDYVTVEDLKGVSDVIEDFKEIFTEDKNDPQSQRMAAAFENYYRAKSSFEAYNTLMREITSGKLQLTGSKGLIGKMTKYNTNENTERFIKALVEDNNYQKDFAAESSTKILLNSELDPDSKLPKLLTFKPRPKNVEQNKPTTVAEKVRQLIDNSSYIKYREIDAEDVLPKDPVELEDYIENLLSNPKSVSKSEQVLIKTILDEEGVSLEDLLVQQRQLNKSDKTTESTSQGIVEADVTNLIEESEVVYDKDGVKVAPRDSRIQQTYDQVFLKGTAENEITIYNITPEGLLKALNIQGDVKVVDQQGKSTIVPADQVNTYKGPGMDFKGIVADVAGTTVEFNFDPHNGNIKMAADVAQNIFQQNGLDVYNSAVTRTNHYLMVYQNGKPMNSDFNDSQTAVKYTAQDIYDINIGDKVRFKFNPQDQYNVRLRNYYQKELDKKPSKKQRKELEDEIRRSLKVQVFDSKGNMVSDLKSEKQTGNIYPEFLSIRELAFDQFMSGNQVETDLGVSVQVEHIFLGLPVLNINNGELTNYDVDPNLVVAQGYFSKGKLTLNEDVDGVNTDLVSRLKKPEVPVVIVKHKSKLIAFPVTMKAKESTYSADKIAEFQRGRNLSSLVVEVNNKLSQLGVNPKDYNLTYAGEEINTIFDPNTESGLTENLEAALTEIENRDRNYSYKDWVKPNFNKTELINQAEIAVDLTSDFMTSPKLMLDYSSSEFNVLPSKSEQKKEETKEVSKVKRKIKDSDVATITWKTLSDLTKRGKEVTRSLAKWKPKLTKLDSGLYVIKVDQKEYTVFKNRNLSEDVILERNTKSNKHLALYISELNRIKNDPNMKPKDKALANKSATKEFLNKNVKGLLVSPIQKGYNINKLLSEQVSENYNKFLGEARELSTAIKQTMESLTKTVKELDIELSTKEQEMVEKSTQFTQETEKLIKQFNKC